MTGRFGALLRTLRRQAGLTQEELSDRSGVGARSIRGFETGERADPRVVTVGLLADALELTPDVRDQLLAAAVGTDHGDTGDGGAAGRVPRQLPAPPGVFVGRHHELAALDKALDTSAGHGGTVVVSAIGGGGGVGKTWLALRWAHHNLDRFPDGQLFVDLRGFAPDGEPSAPGQAVRGFLDALGVPASSVPADLDARAGMYRSLVAGKRMLVVLDNARDTAQVVPLLPGSPTCTVLVTSRDRLTGLAVAHGALPVPLDVLTDADAHDLVARRIGHDRLAAEPEAAAALLRHCAGLPLALAVVAARAALYPDIALAVLAGELRDTATRLGALDAGDPAASVRTVLSWSHAALEPEQAQVLALLGGAPGPDICLAAAASLTGRSESEVGAALRALERVSVIERHTRGRYRMHDLVKVFAADQARRDLPEDTVDDALRRLVGFYLHTADAADRLLAPHRQSATPDPLEPGCVPLPLTDAAAALAWFDAEHQCLLPAVQTAASRGWHQAVSNLAWSLGTFHARRGHRHDQLAISQIGLASAEHLPDPAARIRANRVLGYAYSDVGRHDEAIVHMDRSLGLAEQHHDRLSQAHVHRMLGRAWEQRGDDRRALEHATRALDLYRALDHVMGEADAHNLTGWFHAQLGDYDRARAHCRAALETHRRRHDPEGQAGALDSLGYIDHRTGDHHQAVRHYRQAISLRRDLGHTYQIAESLERLGYSHLALGQREQARTVWREALELYQARRPSADEERIQDALDSLDTGQPEASA
ncbi:tetratricopeptide repeat protein [Solihabitans fulvus]|uniref:tetratricopeptide repeat protein n=1 Tax=Solihabitans fulvus TaxID=1892852 RepID=UPI001CB75EF0|nr:tetratricopeptide repeat protein [Solihabitans fulvus]